jgi:hypothetical protein
MDAIDLFIILAIPATVILVPVYLRFHEKMALMKLVAKAAERGDPISADTINALRTATPPGPTRDLRRGSMLLGLGLALLLMSLAVYMMFPSGDGGQLTAMLLIAAGVVPLCIGGAYLFLAIDQRRLVKG